MVRAFLGVVGNALLVAGAAGLLFVAAALILRPEGRRDAALGLSWLARITTPAPPAGPPRGPDSARGGDGLPGDVAPAPAAPAPVEMFPPPAEAVEAPAAVEPAPAQPSGGVITRLVMPQARVDAEVVPAPIVAVPGGTTWEVPAFKVGHGERTAGAGEPGNAVLFGHVTSLDAGQVFKDLHLLRPGHDVQVYSGERAFDYVVVDVRRVPRTDLSTLQPTETATLSLITCTGAWLPALQDYAERLVVRAELRQG